MATPFTGEAAVRAGRPAAVPTRPTIVAVGASAGGLEAIEQFFAAVSTPSPFAFVIVQHLSPDFRSLMVELLARRTALVIRMVEDGMQPRADAIHLIPPGQTMTIEAGLFRLTGRDPRDFVHHPIDEFFVSLATDRGSEAIGIVLSGSGSDGSRGARAIRGAGGRVLVQSPATARFSSMPQAACEAGCTTEVMPPAAMAAAIREPRPAQPDGPPATPAAGFSPLVADALARAFGIHAAAYRTDILQRRVHRRMMLRGFDAPDAYATLLADDAVEQEALYQDLLIGVTGFLADSASLDALGRKVVPNLAARLDAGQEVTVWVPGCATGEEAYALAMFLLAACHEPVERLPLMVTATDIHRRSLAVAAAGFYSEEAVGSAQAAWRERFLARRGSGYQVIPALREKLSFAAHDLLRDPPPAGMLLVSCRDVLGCLGAAARVGVLGSLAAAVAPGGHLLLGPGETAADRRDLFAAAAKEAPLYRRRRVSTDADRSGGRAPATPCPSPQLTVATGGGGRGERRDPRLAMAQELLVDRYVPPSLLLDEAGQVVHCFGDAGAWLAMPGGRASLAVVEMVAGGLKAPLAAALEQVKLTGRPVILQELALGDSPEAPVLRRLVVEAPLVRPDGQRCLLVSFDDRTDGASLESRPSEALEAALEAVLEDSPDAVALALAAAGTPHRIAATNRAFAAAATAAGLAAPLPGQSLASVLGTLLAGPPPATDQPAAWTTSAGERLTLQTLAAAGHQLAIVRLSPSATLSTPGEAA